MSALTSHLALRVHSLPGPGCGTRHLSGAWSQLSLELPRTIMKFHSAQRRLVSLMKVPTNAYTIKDLL